MELQLPLRWAGHATRAATPPVVDRARRALWVSLFSLLVLAWVLTACGDTATAARIEVTSPDADEILTLTDSDEDPAEPGLQFDVAAMAYGLDAGTMVVVFIDGEATGDTGIVEGDGSILIENVTLPPGRHTMVVRTATRSVNSDEKYEYEYRALLIVSPEDGDEVRAEEDSGASGLQIDVRVQTYALDDLDEAVVLEVDGRQEGRDVPDSTGTAVFEKVALSSGLHRLQASIGKGAGRIRSPEIEISVREACAAIDFISPRPPEVGDRITLGGGDDCPADGKPFVTTVEIATDAGNGRSVTLNVNGTETKGTVNGSIATFENVVFSRMDSPNTLTVLVENSRGVTCERAFPVDIMLDCTGPDCTLVGPVPFDGMDADGNPRLYLNRSHLIGGGFDVDVDAGASADTVRLVVDRNDRKAPIAVPDSQGEAGFAVGLEEGPHTVEALCTDAAGNTSSSGEVEWFVDVTACELTPTAPSENATIVPGDDDDSMPANGVQVIVTSTVVGDGCVEQRAAHCDPSAGVADEDFVSYDGDNPLSSTVTLNDDRVDQSLCVEIRDLAGNVATGSIPVSFRRTAPIVEIKTPAVGSRDFNAMGNGSFSADSLSSGSYPEPCNADFEVLCYEIGVDVQLRHDSAIGPSFASAPCQAPGEGTFAGKAVFDDAPFQDADGTAVVIATQTLSGNSGGTLTGVSSPITLTGDCQPPVLLWLDDCEGEAFEVVAPEDTITRSVQVLDMTWDTVTTNLTASNTDGSSDLVMGSISGGTLTYLSVNFGGSGGTSREVMLAATAVDDFENTAMISCMGYVVYDKPDVTIDWPVEPAVLGPGGCDTGTPGEYGVQVLATVDTNVMRTAAITINPGEPGEQVVPVTIGPGGVIAKCVPVPDDALHGGLPSVIRLEVESTLSSVTEEDEVPLSVSTLQIDDPMEDDVFDEFTPDCNGGNGSVLDYMVLSTVDPIHEGADFTITSPAGQAQGTVTAGTADGCVPLADGSNDIVVELTGTGISRSVRIDNTSDGG